MTIVHEVAWVLFGNIGRGLRFMHDEFNNLICRIVLGLDVLSAPDTPLPRRYARGLEMALVKSSGVVTGSRSKPSTRFEVCPGTKLR